MFTDERNEGEGISGGLWSASSVLCPVKTLRSEQLNLLSFINALTVSSYEQDGDYEYQSVRLILIALR
jgi:hypothetical protein